MAVCLIDLRMNSKDDLFHNGKFHLRLTMKRSGLFWKKEQKILPDKQRKFS